MSLASYFAFKTTGASKKTKQIITDFISSRPVDLSNTAGECTAPGTTYTNRAECSASHADVYSGRVGVWRHGIYGHILNGVFVPDDPNAQTQASKNKAIENAALGIQGDGLKMPGDENVQNPFERFALLGAVVVVGLVMFWRMK